MPRMAHRGAPAGRSRARRADIVVGAVAAVTVIVVAAAGGGVRDTAVSARSGPRTVTYLVTGSPAVVTYGPTGMVFMSGVPLDRTERLRAPLYYDIRARLRGGGLVRCAIKVGRRVVVRATAEGRHGVAVCEVSQDPAGRWHGD